MAAVSEDWKRTGFLQIGDAASVTNLTPRTLRFYEERGLLPAPERMLGGFRLYSPADIARIERIKQLKELLGFSLSEIGEMLDAEEMEEGRPAGRHAAAGRSGHPSDATQSGLRRQLELIDQKMAGMAQMRQEIAIRLSKYDGADALP